MFGLPPRAWRTSSFAVLASGKRSCSRQRMSSIRSTAKAARTSPCSAFGHSALRRPSSRPSVIVRQNSTPSAWAERQEQERGAGIGERCNAAALGQALPGAQSLEASDVEEEGEGAEVGRSKVSHVADDETRAGVCATGGVNVGQGRRPPPHRATPCVPARWCRCLDRSPGRARGRGHRPLALLPIQLRANARRRIGGIALPRCHAQAVRKAVLADHRSSLLTRTKRRSTARRTPSLEGLAPLAHRRGGARA